jgi:Cdc6-like AAA superfamily ATPase
MTRLINSPDLLNSLLTAADAPFNAYHLQHDPVCLPNTRSGLLQDIDSWTGGQDGQCVFWLSGLTGTGKSTIARTVARTSFEKQCFGASFFFSRGGGDTGNAGKFVTSIACQLVENILSLEQYICDAIKERRNIANQSLQDQWQQLVIRPLSKLSENNGQATYVLVVDALDECDNDNNVRIIVQLFGEVRSLKTVRLRIFLTSRSEIPI